MPLERFRLKESFFQPTKIPGYSIQLHGLDATSLLPGIVRQWSFCAKSWANPNHPWAGMGCQNQELGIVILVPICYIHRWAFPERQRRGYQSGVIRGDHNCRGYFLVG